MTNPNCLLIIVIVPGGRFFLAQAKTLLGIMVIIEYHGGSYICSSDLSLIHKHRHSSAVFIAKRMDTHTFVNSLCTVDSPDSVDSILYNYLKIKK